MPLESVGSVRGGRLILRRLGPLFFALVFPLFSFPAHGEVLKGIYGVPSIKGVNPSTYDFRLKAAGVNGVFVPPEKETIDWFRKQGFRVYVSVNAFGGEGAWKKYPDSRPIKADGSPLGSEPGYKGHGGVCPTHQGWREGRLKHIEKLVEQFGGEGGMDPPASPERASGSRWRAGGLWLDFIRYPGFWESKDPRIPDTCYCPRCLKAFERDTGIEIPGGLTVRDTALWIKRNCFYNWMKWKKGQIASFVSEVRDVLKKDRGKRLLTLGLFLVPWTKGERGNAISYLLAQDAFQLSGLADVISPMVYHKMCGRPESWVGYMTRYYKETARCQVWPIVQAMDCTVEEFGEVMRYAGEAGADGVLGYPFGAVAKEGLWKGFGAFHRLPNLMVNGLAQRRKGAKGDAVRITNQRITNNLSESIGLCPGYGECGEWVTSIPSCEPGAEYVFRGEFYQRVWENGAYPMVSMWGNEYLLNTHWRSKVFQPLRVYTTCPTKLRDETFRFINCNPKKTIWLRRPELRRFYRFNPSPPLPLKTSFFNKGFFPIGVWAHDVNDFEKIKRLALNTVLFGGTGEKLKGKVEKCHEVGLRYVLSTPRDPDHLPPYLNAISEYVRPYDVAFYVNDEPGIHSFPINKATDINLLIKNRFPESATCMAVVRPQVCREYEDGADFFMLDQYPVPYMPMTWLSDSLTQAEKQIGGQISEDRRSEDKRGSGRLASVIQAFGGETWADVGWPRLPTWQEMDCLAFLSVVHGSRGIFFFTFSIMGKTEEGRKRLGLVVGRLNRIYRWLVVRNLDERIPVEMLSENRFDPKGRPAVHCCLKKKGDERLLIAVNSIGTYVEARVRVDVTGYSLFGNGEDKKEVEQEPRITNQHITNNSAKRTAREVFSGEDYPLVDRKIRVRFGPYEVKAFLFSEEGG